MKADFEKKLTGGPREFYAIDSSKGQGWSFWGTLRHLDSDLQNHWGRANLFLSKSRYIKGLQCPKILWMTKNMPDEFDAGSMDAGALDYGRRMGELAKSYFGDYVEVPFDRGDLAGMELKTTDLVSKSTPVVCEATFKHDGCLCLVDILRIDANGDAHIIEVKASKRLSDVNLNDIAYQTWVLRGWGLDVKSASLMHPNPAYDCSTLDGDREVDVRELFELIDVTEEVEELIDSVAKNVERMRRWASLKNEPGVFMGEHCNSPYTCGFKAWCTKRMQEREEDLNERAARRALRKEAQQHQMHHLAEAKAEVPRGNPLVVYGENALPHCIDLYVTLSEQIREKNPDAQVLSTNAKSFANGLVNALENGSIEQFSNCCCAVDVLCIPDADDLAGEENMLKCLHRILETMASKGSRVLLAFKQRPSEIGIDEGVLLLDSSGVLLED